MRAFKAFISIAPVPLEPEGTMIVLRTTVLKGSVLAGWGLSAGVGVGVDSVCLRIVSCLISVEGLGELASTLGRPSEGGARLGRPSDGRGDWENELSRGSGRLL